MSMYIPKALIELMRRQRKPVNECKIRFSYRGCFAEAIVCIHRGQLALKAARIENPKTSKEPASLTVAPWPEMAPEKP